MLEKFISSEGTIGRVAFAVRVAVLVAIASGVTFFALRFFSQWHEGTFRPLGVYMGILSGLFCTLIGLMQLLKRLRSMEKPAYFSLLLLLPGINLLFLLYAMVVPGKQAR